MGGARNGEAYLAVVDGITHGIIQEGTTAPGFRPGSTINYLEEFFFTDAGMVFQADTIQSAKGIWFWNTSDIEIVLAENMEFSQLYPGCKVLYLSLLNMNQEGELLFSTALQHMGTSVCPDGGLFTWKAGVFRQILGMAATPECSGQVVGIPARTYADGEIIYCMGDESLSTVADETVRVANGADVTYESPATHLNKGFSVALGGRFAAITP